MRKLAELHLIGPKIAQKIKEQIGGYIKTDEWQNLKKRKQTEQQRTLTEY
jgi:hypothetical protein